MKRVIIWGALLTILWAIGMAPAQAAQTAQVTQSTALGWTWQNPKPQGNDLYSVAYGAGRFVAVGDRGSIVTSADGEHWTVQMAPSTAPLRSVSYAGGRFVAVGGRLPATGTDNGDAIVLTSADGITWSNAWSGDGPALFAVAYGKDRYVAVGGCAWPASLTGRSVLTSADGVTWEPRIDPETAGFCDVAFGQDRFVAVTAHGRSAVHTSADGDHWALTATAGDSEFDGYTWRGVVYASGQFLVMQNYGFVRTSADGEYWTTGASINTGPRPSEMTLAGDRIFAPGEGVTSVDGAAWDRLNINGPVHSVAFGAGRYVAVGEGGFTATSADCVTWRSGAIAPLPPLNAIAYGDGQYLAVGFKGVVLRSSDGTGWTVVSGPQDIDHDWAAANYVDLVRANGKYVALDSHGGKVAVSPDGSRWETTWYTDEPGAPGALLYAGGRFVAGTPGGLITSKDAVHWETVDPTNHLWFVGIARDNSHYVAMADDHDGQAFLFTSPDGTTWQKNPFGRDQISTLAYGNGSFVAVGLRRDNPGETTNYLLTSNDAVHWTVGPEVPFRHVRFENGLFLGTTARDEYEQPGDLYISRDAVAWRLQPTIAPVRGAAFLNGRLFITGQNGAILTSDPVCATFPDLPAAAAECPAVEALVARGVVNGYPDGSFRSEGLVTRAELAKMLTLTLGVAPEPNGSLPFTDTDGHWAAIGGYVQAAVSSGAMNGYPDHTFRPEGSITRAELIKTVVAAAHISPATAPATIYSDVKSGDWYAPWVAAAAQAKWTGPAASGGGLWGSDTLAPDQPATRAEAARLLKDLLQD